MKNIKKIIVVIFLAMLCMPFSHAMMVRFVSNCVGKKSMRSRLCCTIPQEHIKSYGIKSAELPQAAQGVFGDFRLDRDYGIRAMLAPYIAYNKCIALINARRESWQSTQKAYESFLKHNSVKVIHDALNNNCIDTNYAQKALYFSQKVAWDFESFLEYNRAFTHNNSDDAEQYIYTDRSLFSKECLQLLQLLQKEQRDIEILVDFLKQKPTHQSLFYPYEKTKRIELEIQQPRGWGFFVFGEKAKSDEVKKHHSFTKPFQQWEIEQLEMPQCWSDKILGDFSGRPHGYTIYDFLRRYLASDLRVSEQEVEQAAQVYDIKKAFEKFIKHNSPSAIYKASDSGVITKHTAYDALYFTRYVTFALEKYVAALPEDTCDVTVFELLWEAKKIHAQEKSRIC
jgi:hypothetical protein